MNTTKIGWILIGDINTASSRIMGINVHEWLQKHDVWSTLIDKYIDPEDYDTIIFQKTFDRKNYELAKDLKSKGKTIIYILDDLYYEGIIMAKAADIVICGSSYIKEWLQEQTQAKLVVIPDAYETPRDLYKDYYKTDKIKVLWFGTLLHWPQAEEIRPLIQELGYEYITITAHPQATKQWNLNTIWQDIIDSDIIVIPYLGELPPYELAKGNNRLSQSQVLGLPCIVSPIPVYLSMIRQGYTGFIAYNNDLTDWRMYLEILNDSKIREKIGKNGRQAVIDKYSIDSIGQKWMEILNAERIL